MQIEAIYDHGKLELTKPLQLKHQLVKVMVEIPDSEIEAVGEPYNLPPEVVEMANKMKRETDEILNAALPPDEKLPELTEKQRNRIEAFALREDR